MADVVAEQKQAFLDAMSDLYDKSEGTVISDIATANAIANSVFYNRLNALEDSLDYRVATGDDLTDLAVNFGLYRKLASYATGVVTLTGVEGTSIPKGFIVASDTVEYALDSTVIIGATGTVDAPVTATEVGTIGNTAENTITKIPISLTGLSSVNNALAFADAQDEETDTALRNRIDTSLRYPATSGNKNHYYMWAMEVSGVGGARVIVKPLGAGSMRIAIVNTDNDVAPQTLIDSVEEYILEERPATSGVLEVVSATPLNIDVAVTGITIDASSGLSESEVLASIIENVTKYINYFPIDATEVPYVGVAREVIKTEGLSNYTNLTVNSGTSSIPITGIEIPKANSITATVV
jgi:uncharacterized phage protein gp47/JayE